MLSFCSRLHRRLSEEVTAAAAVNINGGDTDVSAVAISPDFYRIFADVVGHQADLHICNGNPVASPLKYLKLDTHFKPEGERNRRMTARFFRIT